jgi:hypothetical protein
MRNKTISISEGLFDLLKQEDNASLLIDRVMWDYYNSIQKSILKDEPKEIIDPITQLEKAEFIERKRMIDEEGERLLEEIRKDLEEKEAERLLL